MKKKYPKNFLKILMDKTNFFNLDHFCIAETTVGEERRNLLGTRIGPGRDEKTFSTLIFFLCLLIFVRRGGSTIG